MRIILLGYMTSGKSTIGKLLMNVLGYTFIDLDSIIEKKENMSISKLFKEKGEIYFRKKEHLHLKELLKNKKNCIISLGGGTPCYANNMQLINDDNNSKSFYLKASVSAIVNRLMDEKETRPLVSQIKSKEAMKEFVAKHLFERSSYYSLADHVINTNEKSQDQLVEEIVLNLF